MTDFHPRHARGRQFLHIASVTGLMSAVITVQTNA